MRTEKVCPYVLRGLGENLEVLAFRHPLAGCQLVKGTLEPGEGVEAGALRELAEEAGIVRASIVAVHWSSSEIAEGQVWHFVSLVVPGLADDFDHFCTDDGGHRFRFFWWRLGDLPGADWHAIFVRALDEIRARHK